MKVEEIMTRQPFFIPAEDTVQHAAEVMREFDYGILPVGNENEVLGMLTDRDIVTRTIADNQNPQEAKVFDIMTKEIFTCNWNDDLEKAADEMRDHNINRLLVKDQEGKIIGLITSKKLLNNLGDQEVSDECLHHLMKATA